jgi:hypothetical protein
VEIPTFEGRVNGVVSFLYLTDKPGELHKRRPICGKVIINVNIPERWG